MKNDVKITHVKEPLIHITKRASISTQLSIVIRVIAILAAMIFAGIIVMILSGKNPIAIYISMFKGAFGTPRRIWNLLNSTAILLGISLAVTPAFRMRFWNCGAEGQTLIGGLATIACMLWFGESLPLPVLFVVIVISSLLAGAVWGLIPSIIKAQFGTNETLFTLMMNYIATQLVKFSLKKWVTDGTTTLPTMTQYRFPKLLDQSYLLTIILVSLVCALLYVYLRYSKQGYEISVVGESENKAKYVGISVKKVIIRTMIISGAICGLIGFIKVAGFNWTVSTETGGGLGFTAIMVSWLAKFNPFSMVLTSGLLTFFQFGAKEVSQKFGYNEAFSEIITGIVLFFIIATEFFLNYRVVIRKSAKGGRDA